MRTFIETVLWYWLIIEIAIIIGSLAGVTNNYLGG